MAFIPIANTVMVEMVYSWDSQICENVYHCQFQAAYDSTEMANLIDVFRGWWNTNIKAYQPANLSLVNIIATDQDSATGPRIEDATSLPIQGTYVSASLPNNCALVVKWTTENRGRSYRGRTFHPGLCEDMVTSNTVLTAIVNALTTAYGVLLTDLATFGAPLVIASRYTEGQPRVNGVATLVTALSIDPIVDSQRRRLPGRGL